MRLFTDKNGKNHGQRIGAFIVTTCVQAQGAPIIDRGTCRDAEGNHYRSRVIRPPFTKHRPVRALVIGWRTYTEGQIAVLHAGHVIREDSTRGA